MRQEWIVGRQPDCDIVIDHPKVSRRHARVRRAGDTHTIEDLGSLAGISVNGRRISGPTPFRQGDTIGFGKHAVSTVAGPLAGLFTGKGPSRGGPLPGRAVAMRREAQLSTGAKWGIVGSLLVLGIGALVAALVGSGGGEAGPSGPARAGGVVVTEADATSPPAPEPDVPAEAAAADAERTGRATPGAPPRWAVKAVFMIALRSRRETQAIGTGFVPAGQKVIVTNHHVADVIRQVCGRTDRCHGVAIQNEAPDKVFKITHIRPHARAGDMARYTPDVSVLTVDRPDDLPRGLPLATADEVTHERLQSSTAFLIGFPGDTMDVQHPTATVAQGSIGRVHPADYIQHQAPMTPGNSGSPLLVAGPKVVGINYANFGLRMVKTVNPDGTFKMERLAQASGLNCAASVRFIHEMF